MIGKQKLKPSYYYTTRFFVYNMALFVLNVFIIGFIDKINTTYTYKTINFDTLFIITLIIALISDCLLFKIVLNKLFFKKYKHFMLKPKFDRISMCFLLKSYLKFRLIPFVIFCILVMLSIFWAHNINIIPSIFFDHITSNNSVYKYSWIFVTLFFITLIFLICFLIIVILKRTVTKNAKILTGY